MRHCNNPDCRLPLNTIPDGNWGDRFCSRWCQRQADRIKYAARKERIKRSAPKRPAPKQIANTPNRHLPFPLSLRRGGARPYLRNRLIDRRPGQVILNCNSQEFENIERLQDALNTTNRQDTIRYCLNAVYASLVRRNKIDGYPQLNLTHPLTADAPSVIKQEKSHEENR